MATEYEGLNEQELRKLLDDAEEYDERAKIRSAIRNLKKASGGKRQRTDTSVYRRPGFQAPKLVQIPNSVTGNVLPSSLKDGESVKPPDKNTPTIGYLNATTTIKSPKRKETTGTSPRSSQSTYSSQQDPAMKDQEGWWNKGSRSSSRSQTPSDTSEQRTYSSNIGESDQVFTTTEQQREPTPEQQREPTPEPPREPTPEPPREPTPEPPREPTPEPPRELTPEPPREPTPEPSPEPITEESSLPSPSPNEPTPDPSPEPPQEPTPEPSSPDLVIESISPADELEYDDIGKEDNQEEEQFSDEEDEELVALEDEERSQLQLVNNSIPLDILQVVEPGLEENKDFRTKLRKTEDTVIDTKAAFPSQKKTAEQVDFRNVLKKTVGGPEKKSFKVEQVDFREKLKPKDSQQGIKNDNEKEVSNTSDYKEVVQEQQQEEQEEKRINIDDDGLEEKSVQSIVEEDSYEARKEARRREREKGLQEKIVTENVTNDADDDSYEARREARRKAREAKKLKEQQGGNKPAMTYKEQQQIDQAKRMEENKKKWNTLDQSSANGTSEKPPVARQKSTGAQRGAQQLLAWCQHKTRYYENVEVKDFSHSFGNGLALCAILHTFVPDDIPYDDLSPDNPTENFGVALQVSEQIGIGSFFDVEDLVSVKAPDPKSMMTFLATIYQHFK